MIRKRFLSTIYDLWYSTDTWVVPVYAEWNFSISLCAKMSKKIRKSDHFCMLWEEALNGANEEEITNANLLVAALCLY
jgi:hypothetical protein